MPCLPSPRFTVSTPSSIVVHSHIKYRVSRLLLLLLFSVRFEFFSSSLCSFLSARTDMHLSIGNIIAILSLIVAIPCTAIMSWEVLRRHQQRDLNDHRTFPLPPPAPRFLKTKKKKKKKRIVKKIRVFK